MGSLITFKDYLKDALVDSEVKKTISDTLGSLSKVPQNAASQLPSFGIGIGLAFLGHYLATKKRGSSAARAIARILGADVDSINRDFVLDKLKDKEYLKTIQEKVLDVIKNKSIDDFAETLGLSSGEAWEVYRQIKDMIVDDEIIGNILQISNKMSHLESTISEAILNLRNSLDEQLRIYYSSLHRGDIEKINTLELLKSYYRVDVDDNKIVSIRDSTQKDLKNWIEAWYQSGKREEKNILLITGEPGTGKSWLAYRIVSKLMKEGYNVSSICCPKK